MVVRRVVRLVPARERVRRDVVREISGFLAGVSEVDLPAFARGQVLNALFRCAEPDCERSWGPFVMMSVADVDRIQREIWALPARDRRVTVLRAFHLVLCNLRVDTGEVMLTREELAERLDCSADRVSEAMSTLFRLGVILKQYRKVPGVRGPGMVVYFVNPDVAWNGSLAKREAVAGPRAAGPARKLRVVK